MIWLLDIVTFFGKESPIKIASYNKLWLISYCDYLVTKLLRGISCLHYRRIEETFLQSLQLWVGTGGRKAAKYNLFPQNFCNSASPHPICQSCAFAICLRDIFLGISLNCRTFGQTNNKAMAMQTWRHNHICSLLFAFCFNELSCPP